MKKMTPKQIKKALDQCLSLTDHYAPTRPCTEICQVNRMVKVYSNKENSFHQAEEVVMFAKAYGLSCYMGYDIVKNQVYAAIF